MGDIAEEKFLMKNLNGDSRQVNGIESHPRDGLERQTQLKQPLKLYKQAIAIQIPSMGRQNFLPSGLVFCNRPGVYPFKNIECAS